MPGIDNLKEFSNDITQVGDEVAIRQKNGTTMPEVSIPDNVPQQDDSLDFEFGLPEPDRDYEIENDDSSGEEDYGSTEDILASIAAESAPKVEEPLDMSTLDPEVAALLNNVIPPTIPIQDVDSITFPEETLSFSDEVPDLDNMLAAANQAANDQTIDDLIDGAKPELVDDLSGLDDLSSLTDLGLDLNPTEPSLDDLSSLDGFENFGSSASPVADSNNNGSQENDGIGDAFSGMSLDDGFGDSSTDLSLNDDFGDSSAGLSLDDGFGDSSAGLSLDDGFGDSSAGLSLDDDFGDSSESLSLDDDFSNSGEAFSMSPGDGFDDLGGDTSDFALDLDDGFDTSGMEDFDADDTSFTADFDDTNFEIPGFSDADAADSRKSPLGLLQKKEEQDNSDRTHLTDNEYKLFQANLQTYPLNLRLAVDKVIVNNEFTDTAIMEVLFKVVKKVSARKLATHLEKMLDITINVPLNYERRTADQYEAYKLSIEYQLKNRIIPGAIAGLILSTVLYILFYLSATFIYKPIRAEMLYNDGYALIENDLYAQSEIKFNEALSYKVKKRWFFKYAQAYRDENQYERARNMYNQLVLRFDYDKQAALEYARMELDDLANYERAAEITRRYILDHYINDRDAMLLLGDIYLDWATASPQGQEKEEYFERARLEYATLMDLYGQTDLYLSRMLRYFIRTDNLREVLTLESYFLSTPKVTLEANDLVELGGYLLEKRYGYLSPSDEYLRSSIENLRKVLELAVKADETIPEAHYNFAQFFVHTDNSAQAIVALNNAITNFEAAEKQTHERTLKHVDSYRLLGEIYTSKEEYLLAEEDFGKGIQVFERAQQTTGLIGNENVGKLYGNMADLDYFISGDLDIALENYLHAVDNFYDTSSVRYKIGYIQYDKERFSEALNSFIKTASDDPSDRNLLLSLGNVLSIRDDDSAAVSHYERLLSILNADRDRYGILFPQVRSDHAVIVDLYLKASNNLGVTLAKLADRTGNTALQTEALGHFSESLRAWDSLTRNQDTMVRLEGSNLAEQNISYLLYPISEFDPAIYASIPRTLYGEEGLKQSSLN